jgi:hypothetical protein
MAKVALATALDVYPCAVAIAWIVVVFATAMGALYGVERAVGVDPSRV